MRPVVDLGALRARAWRVAALAVALCVAGAAAGIPVPTAAATSRAASETEGRVLVATLEGAVTPVMADALVSAIKRAERENYRALVIEIDTPGGLETSMRDMVRALLASRVPVIAWVTPSGGRAASAGVFVTLAADIAAMSPGTNIGAATPISMQGPMDSTLARKVTNDAAALARTVAMQRGRNADWAERAVREAVSIDEREAVKLGVVNFTAATLAELLAESDGRTWKRGEAAHVLSVKGAASDTFDPGFMQRLLAMIADPNIAYILLMLGFYGILFELQNPGAVLPGVVGGISLILAFLALSTMPVNTAGVALIALAIVFFVAELKVASHGLLAAGGIIAMLLGSMILFRGEGWRLSWGVIFGGTVTTALFFGALAVMALRTRGRPVVTGLEGMKGAHGWAVERLAPRGRVRVRGEIWDAVSETEIEAGDEIEVIGGERLRLSVRRSSKEGVS
ncbi:MAG: NfeD family protein [Candidatus Eiseniibacteriota bacterium]